MSDDYGIVQIHAVQLQEEVCRSAPTKKAGAKGTRAKAAKSQQTPKAHAAPKVAGHKATPAQARPVATPKQGSGQKAAAMLQSALDRADTSTPACREAAGTPPAVRQAMVSIHHDVQLHF